MRQLGAHALPANDVPGCTVTSIISSARHGNVSRGALLKPRGRHGWTGTGSGPGAVISNLVRNGVDCTLRPLSRGPVIRAVPLYNRPLVVQGDHLCSFATTNVGLTELRKF